MKVDYINPFIESVYELFSAKLNCEVVKGEVGVFWEPPYNSDIVALIGLSGPARGTVALSFPVSTALSMVGRLKDTDVRIVDDMVKDGVAELVNIVALCAKSKLNDGSTIPIDLSLPTVVRGTHYKVDYPTRTAWLEVPFKSDLGPFSLRVTFERTKEEEAHAHESHASHESGDG